MPSIGLTVADVSSPRQGLGAADPGADDLGSRRKRGLWSVGATPTSCHRFGSMRPVAKGASR